MARTARWYISFAASDGFRGATVVEANDEKGAFSEATMRGLNPGGEAKILRIPDANYDTTDTRRMLNRLAGKLEMMANGGQRLGDLPSSVRERFDHDTICVCEDCNRMRR